MNYKNEISRRIYKAGYVTVKGVVDGSEYGGEDFEMTHAETLSGDYIGSSKKAYRLCKAMGIKPELRTPTSRTCSIGFCEKEQKWYGWSHRSIYGFGVGSEVKKGDYACMPTNADDFLLDMIRFWSDEDHINVKGEHRHEGPDEEGPGVYVTWRYSEAVPNEAIRFRYGGAYCQYPEEYGNGEWIAQTLDDAKQMACDFAESVS